MKPKLDFLHPLCCDHPARSAEPIRAQDHLGTQVISAIGGCHGGWYQQEVRLYACQQPKITHLTPSLWSFTLVGHFFLVSFFCKTSKLQVAGNKAAPSSLAAAYRQSYPTFGVNTNLKKIHISTPPPGIFFYFVKNLHNTHFTLWHFPMLFLGLNQKILPSKHLPGCLTVGSAAYGAIPWSFQPFTAQRPRLDGLPVTGPVVKIFPWLPW